VYNFEFEIMETKNYEEYSVSEFIEEYHEHMYCVKFVINAVMQFDMSVKQNSFEEAAFLHPYPLYYLGPKDLSPCSQEHITCS
jgi:hypothetical protein